jgi:hypothetical protein
VATQRSALSIAVMRLTRPAGLIALALGLVTTAAVVYGGVKVIRDYRGVTASAGTSMDLVGGTLAGQTPIPKLLTRSTPKATATPTARTRGHVLTTERYPKAALAAVGFGTSLNAFLTSGRVGPDVVIGSDPGEESRPSVTRNDNILGALLGPDYENRRLSMVVSWRDRRRDITRVRHLCVTETKGDCSYSLSIKADVDQHSVVEHGVVQVKVTTEVESTLSDYLDDALSDLRPQTVEGTLSLTRADGQWTVAAYHLP